MAIRRASADSALLKTEQTALHPHSYPWSVDELKDACQRKNISYEESAELKALRGVTVSCGQTTIISVRSTLPDAEKIFAFAHELGHVALDDTTAAPARYLLERRNTLPPSHHDRERERRADIWAAHLLIRPEIYEWMLTQGDNGENAISEAEVRTARWLNVPREAVALWRETRTATFAVHPFDWLAMPR